jgi:hypothetical protein
MLPGRIILVILILLSWFAPAPALSSPPIPDQLLPWKDWVLYGHEEQMFCTPQADNPARLQCDWPSEIVLELNDSGGSFTQSWLVQHEQWIQLPGDHENWPERVTVNGEPALVIARQGTPQVKLAQGEYTVKGDFSWAAMPEYLTVPRHSGIVSLALHGRMIHFPELDDQGRIWLQAKKQKEEKIENRLAVRCFRFIDDRIPLQMDIFLQLDVSGSPREVTLGPVFGVDRFIPVSMNSSLPARLEQDGRLRVQVRPGQWNLTLTARHIGQATSLRFARPEDGFWPGEEIWAFNSHPDLRVVEVEGVPAIDPLQTSLPPQWQKYPAYRLLAGDTMQFKEIKRGDPRPAPDRLSMNRNIWLRFDGSGYTLQDMITGAKTSDWRLEMNQPIQLGRVVIDGEEQFITRQEKTGKTGVELRKGQLNLAAESIYDEDIATLPATGWDHDFQQVRASLFLPPGWRLINASGVDTVHGTWVKRWTLLDFFIVLILTIAIARLFSIPLAALAFATLVLMYHEPNAPRWIWLAILICVALLRHLPEGGFKKGIRALQIINILILIGIAVPFSIAQLRTGIYPQLEKPWQSMDAIQPAEPAAAPAQQYGQEPARDKAPAIMESTGRLTGKLEVRKKSPLLQYEGAADSRVYSSAGKVAQYDPSMINQTGPGLPNWQWNTVPMSWSGPVRRDQEIHLFFSCLPRCYASTRPCPARPATYLRRRCSRNCGAGFWNKMTVSLSAPI